MSVSTVIRLEKQGALTPIILGVRTIRYSEDEVEALRSVGFVTVCRKGEE